MTRLRNIMTLSLILGMSTIAGCQPKHKPVDTVFDDLLQSIVAAELEHSPQLAASIAKSEAIPKLPQNSQLEDLSLASATHMQISRLEKLQALLAIDSNALSLDRQTSYATVEDLLSTSAKLDVFPFGSVDLTSAQPYVINHLSGAYLELPTFMASHHAINNLRDAQEYVDKLHLVANAMDDELIHFNSDKNKGIQPPKVILTQIRDIAQEMLETPVEESRFVTTLQYGLEYLEDLDLQTGQALINQAVSITKEDILPAYGRLVEAMDNAQSESDRPIGIDAIPEGPAYYQEAINSYTSMNKTPEQIHNLGLTLVESISANLDLMLIQQELTEGSVGERLALLGSREDQLFEDSDEGRAALLEFVTNNLTNIQSKLPRAFEKIPSLPIDIVGVSTNLEKSAKMDGANTGTFNIGLRDISHWPKWTLATLSYHEAIPGHYLQSSQQKSAKLPLIRQLARYPAFVEGWALYSEDLADEIGAYTDDPLGRIGYLQSLLLRAASLVVDTGIHSQNWTREQAVTYLSNITGYSRTLMEIEVDRYIVWPGQACSYMLGREEIRELRKKADQALGNSFDIKAFHSVILNKGARPFDVVRADIDAWIATKETL